VRLLLVPHAVVLATEAVAAVGALELTVTRVHNVVPFEVFACGESLGALTTLKSFFTGMTFRIATNRVGTLDLYLGQNGRGAFDLDHVMLGLHVFDK
jgi:hypothetical protein